MLTSSNFGNTAEVINSYEVLELQETSKSPLDMATT
jgi:hypothetical protein